MSITFGEARKILARYAGKGGLCPDDPEVELFVKKVLQQLLYSGEYGNLRKFCFHATQGCFTIPYELETPLKVKVDNLVGTVWDKWFEWHSSNDLLNCIPADRALQEDPNYYPTVFEIPPGGARIGCLATCGEAEGANMTVKGEDATGREIFSVHNGEQVSGETLRLSRGEIRYTNVTFAKITGIVKPKTNGYVQLLWIKPEENRKGFLADYSPLETSPQYRRFVVTSPCSGVAKVSVLGRIRLKPNYADNDYIPFDNYYALELGGQSQNSNYNDNMAVATQKDAILTNVIEKENSFRRIQNGQPMEIHKTTSAGRIKNIVG